MMRRSALLGLSAIAFCGLLALCLSLAWAAEEKQEKQQPPLRAQNRLSKNEALHVLGQVRRRISDEDRDTLDLDNASGLKRTWEAITTFVPIKTDKLVFPKERGPVWLLVFFREMGSDSGIMAGLPPSIYVVVCKPGSETAELFNFFSREEAVKTIPMKVEDLEKEQTTPIWLLRQQGKEISYHLTLGTKHYSWIIVSAEEESKPK